MFIERFQSHFEGLMSGSFNQLLTLIPYFSWGDETSYWDQNFTFRAALERHPEYDDARMYSFLQRFDFRENVLVEDLLERLENYFYSRKLQPPKLNDELILTYFPSMDSTLHKLHGDAIDASLLSKLDDISALGSDSAWRNIQRLMDTSYNNPRILTKTAALRSR